MDSDNLHILMRKKSNNEVTENEKIIRQWNSDTDVLIVDKDALLPRSHPDVAKHSLWAYSLNTAKGFYFLHTENIPQSEKIVLNNGDSITFNHIEQIAYLRFANAETTRNLYKNVTVWSHDFFHDFMVVTLHETDQTILIDSRGELFELPISGKQKFVNSYIKQDKREGYYLIDGNVIVRYKTKEEQTEFDEKTSANLETIFNKDFNRFARANANNNQKYLYLTVDNSKCGALVKRFIKQGMQYEIVPNILLDDETVNIRIPLEGENAKRIDVQFLCAKYIGTYSIYNIPYSEIGSKLDLNQTQMEKLRKNGVFFNETSNNGYETISYFIINTFRNMFNTSDDYEIYKKIFSKIVRMISRGHGKMDYNYFSEFLLLHPSDHGLDEKYITQKMIYINELLLTNDGHSWDELCREQETRLGFSCSILSLNNVYYYAYQCSKNRYNQVMSLYENEVICQITQNGETINKWKSEATLFALVKKEYPDAIFQYHSEWLGLQSLDIFIPSLCLAIEYQGEQHYRPIDIFGGEEAFRKLVTRDKRKAMLCNENNVTLIYWKYDEVINNNRLQKKIREAIPEL